MRFLMDSLRFRPRPPKEGPEYADIYPRGVAAGIDLMLLFLLLSSSFQLISSKLYQGVNAELIHSIQPGIHLSEALQRVWYSGLGPLWIFNTIFQVVVIGIVMIAVQTLWGTTPGKWLMGVKIVRHKTLEPISPWRYALRFFGYIPALLPLMIGIFWISFNKERRGFHDYIAGTVVLNLRPHGWYWNHFKRLFKRSRPVEETVSEPAAEQGHQDSDKTIP